MTIYVKKRRPKPIRLRDLYPWEDPQAAVPRAWCGRCGGEVFDEGKSICTECEEEIGNE